MRRMRKHDSGCDINMTPMIDIVFQLIIFFIVTVKMDQEINEEVKLALAPHGPLLKEQNPPATIIEIDRRGWISMRGVPVTRRALRNLVYRRYKRLGSGFPVLIRADKKTRHVDVRSVMDMCTDVGIWRIEFAAIQEKKTQD